MALVRRWCVNQSLTHILCTVASKCATVEDISAIKRIELRPIQL